MVRWRRQHTYVCCPKADCGWELRAHGHSSGLLDLALLTYEVHYIREHLIADLVAGAEEPLVARARIVRK